jgi:GLPGLI family protein
MKKITFIGAAATLLFSTAFINPSKDFPGKDDFEGTMIFDIQFEPSASLPAEYLPMMEGSNLELQIKGDKVRSDMKTGPYSTIAISDKKANTSIQLIDANGKKIMVKTKLDSINKVQQEESGIPEITYLNDTKEIAGYKCKNAKVVIKTKTGEEYDYIAWYTDQLPYSNENEKIKGLKGFPLEYKMHKGGMVFTLTAKSITKGKVPDSAFEIPSGYTEMTPEQMKKAMGRRQ